MLSAYSAETIAYQGDEGFIVCRECAIKMSSELSIEKADQGYANASGLYPMSRYSLESDWPDGLSCENCGAVLVEPPEEEESVEVEPVPVECPFCGGPSDVIRVIESKVEERRCRRCDIGSFTIYVPR